MLSHYKKRAARALLAGLLLMTPGLTAQAQSTTPTPTKAASPTTGKSSSSNGKTATPPSATDTASDKSPSSLLPNPASSQPVPLPVRADAQATDASSSPHGPGDAPTENEMHNIVISAATRNEQAPNTTATDTTVVTQEDLEAQNYANVADALREVPGIAVVPSGTPGQVTSIFIHGADSNQTLFTVDGRPQPVGLSGATDFTNLVSLNGRGLAQPESSVSFEGGSFDTFTEKAQSRGSIGNFDYAVSASNENSDMNRENENYQNTVYRGNFGYQATPNIYVDVHTGWSQAEAGAPNVVESSDPVADLLTTDFFISPEVSAKVTDFYTTKFYYNHDQSRQTYHDLFTGAYFPTSTRLNLVTDSYDWQNDLQLARNWQITAGVQGYSQHANQVDDEDADAEAAAFLSHGYINNTLDNVAGYVQSQWQPLTGLNVLSSIRYDGYSDYSNALSWRQGVTYEIAPTKTVVHASGSSSYTPPPAQDLYYPGFNNPSLKPESALGWEAGVEQPLLDGKLTPSATYFHNDITNYILSLAPNFLPENVGSVTTEGVDVDVAAKPMDNLKLDLNYTYLMAENNTEDIRLVRRPTNSLNFTAIYTPVAPLTLTIGGSWVMGREDIDPVTFSQENAPDYFTLRASATYTINKYVTVWLRGENLTNEQYQPVLGYPALGIAGYGGIKVSF